MKATLLSILLFSSLIATVSLISAGVFYGGITGSFVSAYFALKLIKECDKELGN